MPSVQTIDLNPGPRTELTNLEKTLSGFSQRNRQNQLEERENDALKDIYSQYQQDGQNLQKTIQDIQSRPGISPTTRVNTVKQLLEFQKHNNELQKQADREQKITEHQKTKELEKQRQEDLEESKRARTKAALEKSGASPEQIALYDVSPVGGQTKIVESIVEEGQRKITNEMIPSDSFDYDSNLLPKERVKRQDARFSLQTPLIIKNSETLSSLENESSSLNLLDELTNTGKVGTGLNKLNINPKTGDLFIPQLASPEEQLFVKTVNDFTVKAKDSFGARVTNFELDRFMQRLPTLANSNEGRKLIIRQMKIVNQLNQIEKKALQDIFDQYGVRNIDYVDAENKARETIKDQKEALRKEYFNIEQLSKKEDSEQIKNLKSKVQDGYTAMRKPDGTIKQFPTKNVPNLEEKGYKKI